MWAPLRSSGIFLPKELELHPSSVRGGNRGVEELRRVSGTERQKDRRRAVPAQGLWRAKPCDAMNGSARVASGSPWSAGMATGWALLFLQVLILLYIADWMVHWMWGRGLDPDNFSIPYLTALGDLLGTGLLALSFHVLWLIGDRDTDVGD
uniref:Solute carrier family 41 member n=1 Tax=Sus scrofa TaxID=9823 RepID=A0A480JEJ4_PIG